MCYDYDGNALSQTTERPYLERFIHGEVYRARTDVVAVVHSHSPSVIPFPVTNNRLRPVFHMSGFLGSGSAQFEIRDVGGNTDRLIRNSHLGQARALGNCNCVLTRGHGSTVVGASLGPAVYRAIYAEVNAKLELQAQGLGEITFPNEEEARLASDTNDGQIPRSWNLWLRRLGQIDIGD